MTTVGIVWEDFVNYKKICTTIMMPYCSFKCDKECGMDVCQNSKLANAEKEVYSDEAIIRNYIDNDISNALVFQGLEPFDSWNQLLPFIDSFRKQCNDDIIIYTGYTEDEIADKIDQLKKYSNIIVKFGRYIPNNIDHYDDILGVKLASDNQYAKIISNE